MADPFSRALSFTRSFLFICTAILRQDWVLLSYPAEDRQSGDKGCKSDQAWCSDVYKLLSGVWFGSKQRWTFTISSFLLCRGGEGGGVPSSSGSHPEAEAEPSVCKNVIFCAPSGLESFRRDSAHSTPVRTISHGDSFMSSQGHMVDSDKASTSAIISD